mgnify:CR=1 FL=1
MGGEANTDGWGRSMWGQADWGDTNLVVQGWGRLGWGSQAYGDSPSVLLSGLSATAAELNILDGGTSATSTTVADADRLVLNDNGTMVQVAVTDLKTYVHTNTSINDLSDGTATVSYTHLRAHET